MTRTIDSDAVSAVATERAPASTRTPIGTAALPGLRTLVVDDERAVRDNLAMALRLLGCRVDSAETIDAALSLVRADRYDLAFIDLMLGATNGIDLLPKLLAANADLQIVVVTGFATYETAIRAVKSGAANYLQKPWDPAKIAEIVDQTIEDQRQAKSYMDLEKNARAGLDGTVLTSKSAGMQMAWSVIGRAAASDVPVLLRGESGTGKGMLARALHRQSERAPEPFVTINCPSLSDELLISELFGHVKGAFTGSVRDQIGKVEAADGGTVFLDEIGDLSPTVQAKLLRFLQDRTYERLGETTTRLADVRIVAATNRDLEAAVREGKFREDLLYRLNVVELTLPPLRERRDDLIDLARHFMAVFALAANKQPQELSPEAEKVMLNYSWPGNIRELRNELQRIQVLWPTKVVGPEAFSSRVHLNQNVGPTLGEMHSLADIENEHIRKVLAKTNSFEEAASVLGIEPSTLWRKRRKLGL
jgi:NtrC-family two-component system response regulator AlgB